MKLNFPDTIKTKTDEELKNISKNHSFYSPEQRLLALKELECRNSLSDELSEIKNRLEYSAKMDDEDNEPKHKVSLLYIIPNKDYIFTPILIYLNVFIFLLMVLFGGNFFAPDINTLLNWGGNLRDLTLNGQYWRLLSSSFLHAGVLHLAFNMYVLLYVGSLLEKAIGKNKFILAYLISGLTASASSIIVNRNIVSVGASGAIFGLFGVLLSLLPFKDFKINNLSKKSLLSNTSLFVFYNLIYGFGKVGIDNAAHVGGLFAGFIIGIIYYNTIKKELIKIVGD